MYALARLATRRPVAVTVFAAAVAILGWTAWSRIPVDLLPDIQSPTIVVSIRSGDRPPAEMERIYGEQVEQRLFTVRGIRSVAQVARTGRLVATVTFDWESDMDLSMVDVQKALAPISSDRDVDEVLIRRFDPRQAPVMSVGLIAEAEEVDLAELRRIARRQIAPALERLPGVAEVQVLGGREREIRVEVDPYRLQAHGLDLLLLETRVQAANLDLNAGTLEERDRVFLIRGLSRFRSTRDVEAVVLTYERAADGRLKPVLLGDVARVREADRDVSHLVRVNGVEGVGLSIHKEAGTNTVSVSRTVRRGLDQLTLDLSGIRFVPVTDEAALVEDSIADVRVAALAGIVLAVLVLALFLRSLAPTAVVAVSVPVSLLGTLFLMSFAGYSLNVMTMAGLALGAGMLIDNAIVVVESIFRRLAEGDTLAEAAARGAGDVSGAIAASTLTTCVVFLPVLFLRGLAARLVAGLSFTVVVSLLASLLVAVLLIPALSVWLLPRRGVRVADPGISRVVRFVRVLLRRPLVVVAAAGAAVAGAILALSSLGTELLPPTDPRQFSARLSGPPGQRVESTARSVELVESVLRDVGGDEIAATLSEVGRVPEDDRLIDAEQSEENTARIHVRVGPGRLGAREIVSAAASRLDELPRHRIDWGVGLSALARALGTGGPPIVVEIQGQSLEDLRQQASLVRDAMASRSELWNVRSSFEGGPPELRVELRRTIADGLGVGLDDVARVLEAALDGRRATVLVRGDEEQDVVLRTPAVRRDELERLPLTAAGGTRVALGDIARLVPAEGAREIFRRDQRRVAEVTARIAPGATYPQARAAAESALEQAALLPGLRGRLTGEEEERAKTFAELRQALLLASLLVFMVLAGKFESLLHPVTVLFCLPLSAVGVAAALLPSGRPIGVMAMLGMVLLAGVAVNDAILLLDTVQQLRRKGLERREAVARAVGVRLRPILMTTATTVLAIAPLAIGSGESVSLRAPLALTVVGGVIASTLGSLFVIPCVYELLERLRPSRADA